MPSTLHPPSFDHLHRPPSPRRTNSMPVSSPTHDSSPSSSSPSLSIPSTFAPPFYNRPPTPLPPSPSLTSLLRPSFTPSRPTTPDSSDSEGIPRASSSLAKIISGTPRYAPKVPPTYEYYGFGLYVLSNFAAILYLIWSFCPSEVLGGALGVTYYPSRWWSLVIPAYLVVVIGYIYVALAAWNTTVLTRPLENLECVVDRGANIAAVTLEEHGEKVELEMEEELEIVEPEEGKSERWGDWGRKVHRREDWGMVWSRGTDAVMDVPIGGVCEVLYGEGRAKEEWELRWEEEEEERERRREVNRLKRKEKRKELGSENDRILR